MGSGTVSRVVLLPSGVVIVTIEADAGGAIHTIYLAPNGGFGRTTRK